MTEETGERVPLAVTTFGKDEIYEALESLMSGRVTMGKKVRAFEEAFADKAGTRFHAVMVNSGTSAALVALIASMYADTSKPIPRGSEVILPALSWASPAFAVALLGLKPVFVDVDLQTLNVDAEHVAPAISSETKAVIPVHMMGNPAPMDRILEACHGDMVVIEDSCETIGAYYQGKWVGSMGDAGIYSFYFSHHLCTIEGGMIITKDDRLAESLKSVRNYGLSRGIANEADYMRRYPEIDSSFLFMYPGLNVKPTEIQGAFGIHQLKRLDQTVREHVEKADEFARGFAAYDDYFMVPKLSKDCVYMAYPVFMRECGKRQAFMEFMRRNGIAMRPIEAGKIPAQPAFRNLDYRIVGELPNVTKIVDDGFYLGVYKEADTDYIFQVIDAFVKGGDSEL